MGARAGSAEVRPCAVEGDRGPATQEEDEPERGGAVLRHLASGVDQGGAQEVLAHGALGGAHRQCSARAPQRDHPHGGGLSGRQDETMARHADLDE